MTNNILVLGCSFSKWGDNSGDLACDKSWPRMLSEQLTNYNVYNVAMYGNSTQFQLLQLGYYLEKLDPVVTIWQLPPLHRSSYYVNGIDDTKSMFNRLKFENDSPNYFYSTQWHHVIQHSATFTKYLNEAPRSLKKTRDYIVKKENVNIHKSLIKKSVAHGHREFDYANINYGKRILKDRNSIVYQHIKRYSREDTDFCVQEEFPDKWEDYCADSGFHFTQEGNDAVLNKLIMPRIQKYV